MNENYILCAFKQKVVPLLVKEGKDDLLPVIVSYMDKQPGVLEKLPDKVKNMLGSVKIKTLAVFYLWSAFFHNIIYCTFFSFPDHNNKDIQFVVDYFINKSVSRA